MDKAETPLMDGSCRYFSEGAHQVVFFTKNINYTTTCINQTYVPMTAAVAAVVIIAATNLPTKLDCAEVSSPPLVINISITANNAIL